MNRLIAIIFLGNLIPLISFCQETKCDKKISFDFTGQIDCDSYNNNRFLDKVRVYLTNNNESVIYTETFTNEAGRFSLNFCTDTLNFFRVRFSKPGYISKYCVIDFRPFWNGKRTTDNFSFDVNSTLFKTETLKDLKLIALSEKIPAAQAIYDPILDNFVWDIDMIEVFKEVKGFFNDYVSSNAKADSIKEQDRLKSIEISNLNQNNLKEKNQKLVLAFILFAIVGALTFIVIYFMRVRKSRNILAENNKLIEWKNQLLEEKQKEITDSINYAKRIQSTLLENAKDLEFLKNDKFIFFQPKDIVSGDFYWVKKKHDFIYMAVCDSTGHGVPGAFMSLLNSSLMNEAVMARNISNPGEVFSFVREGLINHLDHENSKDGMDGILMEFSNSKIRYAAGNNAPVVIRNGSILELELDKMPIGFSDKKTPFRTFEFNPQKEDMIYLYTDGYADQFGGAKGKKFKYANLNKLLASISQQPMAEQRQILEKTINDWKGDLEQVDDICILGFRI